MRPKSLTQTQTTRMKCLRNNDGDGCSSTFCAGAGNLKLPLPGNCIAMRLPQRECLALLAVRPLPEESFETSSSYYIPILIPVQWLRSTSGHFQRTTGTHCTSSGGLLSTSPIRSGLLNQSVFAVCVAGICIISHELMKRKRRGRKVEGLGSVESWEFG
jgi:hypothetical protein